MYLPNVCNSCDILQLNINVKHERNDQIENKIISYVRHRCQNLLWHFWHTFLFCFVLFCSNSQRKITNLMVYFKNVHLKNKHNKRIVTENKNKTPNLSTVEENKTFGNWYVFSAKRIKCLKLDWIIKQKQWTFYK